MKQKEQFCMTRADAGHYGRMILLELKITLNRDSMVVMWLACFELRTRGLYQRNSRDGGA